MAFTLSFKGPKNSCQGNVQKQPMSRESSTNGFLVSCWGSIFNGWGWVCLSVSLSSSRFVWVSAHGTRIQEDTHRQSVSVEAVHCNHPIRAGDPMVWPKIIKNRSPLILFDTLCVLKIAIATGFFKKKRHRPKSFKTPCLNVANHRFSMAGAPGFWSTLKDRGHETKPAQERFFLILKRLYSSPPKR